jgi:membrane protein
VSDGQPVSGDAQPPQADVVPTPLAEVAQPPVEELPPPPPPLDEQDLELLDAVGLSEADVTDLHRKILGRMSPRTKGWLFWSARHWPGRIAFRLATGLRHLLIFDRAMTIAAQMFTSVFPIIIMGASLAGGRNASEAIGGTGLPPEAESVLNDVVSAGSFGAFGVIGILVVLISATSLSRALTRAYDTIWRHPRTKLPPKGTWRWLAAVMVLALSVVVSHKLVTFVDRVPPPNFWGLLMVFAVPAAIACYVPWMLMAGRIRVRLLLPGAVMFGVLMVLAHPISDRYLSNAIAVSAQRYGAIGVAFTYLTYLYCVAWVLLATAVLGRVIVIEPSVVGRLIRGPVSLEEASGTGGDDEVLFS